jgi:hypothetical protein
MVDLTPEQEKALIDAATERCERDYTEKEQKEAAYFFLAGVRWALDEIEGAALATADIAVNEFFVEDAIVPLRAQINALGGPQPQDGREPPQEEGEA